MKTITINVEDEGIKVICEGLKDMDVAAICMAVIDNILNNPDSDLSVKQVKLNALLPKSTEVH